MVVKEGAVEAVRLEPRDVEFVDIIHTDGSAFLNSLGMGYRTSIGFFYYAIQPIIKESVLLSIRKIWIVERIKLIAYVGYAFSELRSTLFIFSTVY
ncbi:hypothetical protein EB796_012897 [Bugula neritina]|uniref:Lipase domain-containing protein n=1 Tax=Bugula neritina TaxID=10212 RepID=A0A7J7JSZ9_BUGNE|nr:hypothetical protein EB796_012897 [Bugula neritina]